MLLNVEWIVRQIYILIRVLHMFKTYLEIYILKTYLEIQYICVVNVILQIYLIILYYK